MIKARKDLIFKISILWLGTVLAAGFLLSRALDAAPATMSVLPTVPKLGEPVVVTFNMNNPSAKPKTTSYHLYANNQLIASGQSDLPASSSTRYRYAYERKVEIGQQVNFILQTDSPSGKYETNVASPPYPPQTLSSFVSFAAFSTTVMSAMITMEYFKQAFGTTGGLNIGIIFTLVLVASLIFLELTQGLTKREGMTVLRRYRVNYGLVSTILFIIFVGLVLTNVAIALAV